MMIKRIGITGALLIAAFALSSIAAASASASACYKVSEFKSGTKGGNFSSPTCATEVKKLTGEYVLATIKTHTVGNLWCAELLLSSSEVEGDTGYFTSSTCATVLTGSSVNDSNWTEVLWLPDVSTTLAGSSYPLHLNYESSTVATLLEDANGGVLEGTGLKLLLLTGELTALGTFRADFANVKEVVAPKHNCHTSNDPTATVLTEGSFHVVITSLFPNLQIGLLFLPNEVKIECEGINLKVKGSVIASINTNGITETTELTNIKGLLAKGSTVASQQVSEYYNDSGTKVKAGLITTVAGVENASNEQVKEETTFTALPPSGSTVANMFVITDW